MEVGAYVVIIGKKSETRRFLEFNVGITYLFLFGYNSSLVNEKGDDCRDED